MRGVLPGLCIVLIVLTSVVLTSTLLQVTRLLDDMDSKKYGFEFHPHPKESAGGGGKKKGGSYQPAVAALTLVRISSGLP